MVRKIEWYTLVHKADGDQLPGVQVAESAFVAWGERLEQSIDALKCRWQGWVTARSVRTSIGRTGTNSPPVGAPGE